MVEGEELAPNPIQFFFFFFYLIHALFFRYKKLRAALAMERTKPLNQNTKQKKPFLYSSAVTEITLRLKPFAH